MGKDVTIEEVGHAVEALRKSVEDNTFKEEKRERIEAVLDAYEEKNQELTVATEQNRAHAASLKAFKEELEQKSVEAGKMREQVDAFEIALAKSIKQNVDIDPKDTPEYKAFESFVLEGAERMNPETKAELRTDKATEGGVLVTSEMESRIVKKITEIDAIRSIARVRPISNKSLVVPIETGIPTALYEGESEEGANSVQAYGSETLTAYRLTHTVPITRDMLMDSAFDMNTEILDASSRAFALAEGNGFVLGSGSKVPSGFMNDSRISTINSSTTDVVSGDDLMRLQGELKVGYQGTFVFNRKTLAQIRIERSTNTGYLWSPALNGPAPAEIAGSPYILAPSVVDEGGDVRPMAYGDFSVGYLIVDRTATEVIRDDYTRKKEAVVEFTLHRWNTGRVVVPEAIKILITT